MANNNKNSWMGEAAKDWDEDEEYVIESSKDDGKTWQASYYVDGVQQLADTLNTNNKRFTSFRYRGRSTGEKSEMLGESIANVDASNAHANELTANGDGSFTDSSGNLCDSSGNRLY